MSEKNELNTGYGYFHTRSIAPFTGACRLNRGVAYGSFTQGPENDGFLYYAM